MWVIIKCEGLFRARVNPNVISSSVPREKLAHLVSILHKFARDWLQACRKRTKLEYQIYGKSLCTVCNTNVMLIRNTQQDGRITYYCNVCQGSGLPSTVKKVSSNTTGMIDLFVIPKCKCISLSTRLPSLQRVRKPGPTHNRLFFGCANRGRKSCGFFAWADTRFPRCLHNQTATIRRVLKTEGGNNGRYFFCCAAQSDHCKYFQWVDRVPCENTRGAVNADRNKRTYSDMKASHVEMSSKQVPKGTCTSTSVSGNILNGANANAKASTNASASGSSIDNMVEKRAAVIFKFKTLPDCIRIPL